MRKALLIALLSCGILNTPTLANVYLPKNGTAYILGDLPGGGVTGSIFAEFQHPPFPNFNTADNGLTSFVGLFVNGSVTNATTCCSGSFAFAESNYPPPPFDTYAPGLLDITDASRLLTVFSESIFYTTDPNYPINDANYRIYLSLPEGLSVTTTPIPPALALFLTGLLALGLLGWRQKSRNAAA